MSVPLLTARRYLLLACISLFAHFGACTDKAVDPVKPAADINDVVRNAGKLSAMPQGLSRDIMGTITETSNEGGHQWVSQSKKMRLSNKFDEIVALNSAYNDALYPGALIQGKDLLDGKLTSIGDFAREPVTLTINSSSEQVNAPTKATVEEAIGTLVKKAGPGPADIIYHREELHTAEQSFLELGLSVSWLTGSVATKFQKDKSIKKSSVLLYFKQVYYTVSVNSPSAPADVFAPGISVADLQQRIYSGNPACYISQVQYGRMILAKITSTETIDAMAAAFHGAWVALGAEGKIDQSKIGFDCSVDAVVLGGSANGAADAVTGGTLDDINRLIREEALFEPGRPAYPIAYTVRYLSDGSPVQLGSTVEYTVPEWKLDPNSFQQFDLYFSHFDIVDDGNTFTDGDFYYTIQITDSQGRLLQDSRGNDAVIELPREAAVETGSGGKVQVGKQMYGLVVKKAAGEQFMVGAELWDKYQFSADVKAGGQGYSFKYLWNNLSSDWHTMDLVASEGSYVTRLVFRVEKK